MLNIFYGLSCLFGIIRVILAVELTIMVFILGGFFVVAVVVVLLSLKQNIYNRE